MERMWESKQKCYVLMYSGHVYILKNIFRNQGEFVQNKALNNI